MRRRRAGTVPDLAGRVDLWVRTRDEAAALFTDEDARRRYVDAVLAEHGTDAIEAIQARRVLRRRGRKR